jgi:heat shock protein HtpX
MASGKSSSPARAGGSRSRQRQQRGRPDRRRPGAPAEPTVPTLPPIADTRRVAVAANRRRAATVTFLPAIALAAVLLATLAAGVPLVAALVPAVLLLLLAWAAWSAAPALLVRRMRRLGTVPDETEQARLYNVVEGVCLSAGVPTPDLLVIDDPAPNMISAGRMPEDAVIVCTSGLLALLDRIELEAAVAHEVAHIRARDMWSGAIVAFVLGSIAPGLAARLSGTARETLADQTAATTTRYPPGLVSALGKVRAAPTVRPAALPSGVVRATSHLWLAPLVPARPNAKVVAGALDLDERIDLLVEL